MVPQRYLCSMEGPVDMLVTWLKGIKFAQRHNIDNQVALR